MFPENSPSPGDGTHKKGRDPRSAEVATPETVPVISANAAPVTESGTISALTKANTV